MRGPTPTEPDVSHLEEAEAKAKDEWWRRLIKRKRKPEGVFDGDTGLFTPSENEAPLTSTDGNPFVPNLRPRPPRYFTTSSHIWSLVQRACRGEPVPADIAESFRDEYGAINERLTLAAVKGRMKAEDREHVKRQRELGKAERAAAAATTDARIAHKEELIRNLQRKVRLFETKIQKHRRSISALKTAAARKAKTP